MCKIIFIGNYKGGVGKTTTTLNLAQYFSKKNHKVLTIDLDPQSSLSEIQVSNFLGMLLKDIPDSETLNYVYDLSIMKIKKYPNLDLQFSSSIIKRADNYNFIPSSLFYKDGKGLDSLAINMEESFEYLSILKSYIDTIKDNYNFILIDCPPSSNLITQSAFLLSDYFLIPTVLDEISTNGVIHYIHTVQNTYKKYCVEHDDAILAKHYFGNRPELIGVFYNLIRGQVNYDVASSNFEEALKNTGDVYIFPYNINNYIDIARSTEKGKVSKEKNDFAHFSELVLNRLDAMQEK
ncbi:MAG: AAA family ATPase [Clostridiales bacterium]|nr:AAA family ATPase [Clostridiales bacterium]